MHLLLNLAIERSTNWLIHSIMFVLMAFASSGIPATVTSQANSIQEEVEERVPLSCSRQIQAKRQPRPFADCHLGDHTCVSLSAFKQKTPFAIVGHRLAHDRRAPIRC
ncbi:hypothetical protein [Roseiconus lacunae]|uniref:Secreted protein n=1 Tax=Roseiconus lacunae TaxID=2605694 RepID=A0ABT7PN40_9BACT|nr:hypothetical protein [Roseiconus lacunae]MCD0463296.1 hypothetical protein [Roseiconus lacunae]MDM4017923.1 hypothetical protein [Roseiconus lacunae]WRQ52502.1 hypothetical protein U8335_08135 [Stieleria sp. HD01]